MTIPRYFSAVVLQGLFLVSVHWISLFGGHYTETFIELGVFWWVSFWFGLVFFFFFLLVVAVSDPIDCIIRLFYKE